MRILGILLFVIGCAGTALATVHIHRRRRPADVAFSVVAPLAAVVALVGLLLAFVPDFFG